MNRKPRDGKTPGLSRILKMAEGEFVRGLAFILGLLALSGNARSEGWWQFRGNDSSGVSSETNLPTKLDEANALKWKISLPGRGVSGPIVVGARVFLTASSGYRDDRLHVLCFSCASGEQLWERQFKATGRTVCHEVICMATPQPCSDGERIYAYYSSNDVICLDLDGNLNWYRGLGLDYPNASSSLAMSSSPLVVNGTLVLQLGTDSESFVAGLNALTGETCWKLDQENSAIYASPVLFRSSANPQPQVILHSKRSLISLDPRTGHENWKIEQVCKNISSTTVAGDVLVTPFNELTALRPHGISGSPQLLWSEARLSPDASTPVVYQDRVHVLKGSVLSCADLTTGKIDWQLRLKCNNAYASLLAGNGHLYVVDENGVLQSIRLGGKKGEVASRIDLEERIMCTPALAGGALYVRSDKHLWKFAGTD
jgi:outer membrane protein assembly factor BamB